MISTADFKRGLVIQVDGAPCVILDVAFQSPRPAAPTPW